MAAGAFRLTELTGGAAVTPANARFFASPLPVVVHIVSASVFSLLGAFQFSTPFRRRRPGWHRIAGRLVAPCRAAGGTFSPLDDPFLSPPGGRR